MHEELMGSKQPPTLGGALYALLLAFLSVAGIACAWVYQYGRAQYFKIPKSVIRIEISEVGLALLYLAPCLVPIFFAPLIGKAGRKHVLWIALPCLAFLGFAADALIQHATGLAGACAWWAFILLISVGVNESLMETTKGSGTMPWLAGLTIFSMLVSGSLGSLVARSQRDFYVIAEGNTEYVVLALYSDRLVLAPLSAKDDVIEAKVEIRKLDKDPVMSERWRLSSLTVTDFVEVDSKRRAELRAQRVARASFSALKP